MDTVFFVLLTAGIGAELIWKGGDAVLTSLIDGAKTAVQTGVTMAGGYLFWLGMLGVVREAGLMRKLSGLLKKRLHALFPDAGEAIEPIALNLSCNMLGLGNAATPYGLTAMRLMERNNPRPGVATDGMCVLLALNASCLELFPSSLIALRASFGSARPAAVVPPVLLASACSTLLTALLCRACVRR